ncbi:MAG: hypothetical protein ACP5U0_08120 [Caldisphaera sp.]
MVKDCIPIEKQNENAHRTLKLIKTILIDYYFKKEKRLRNIVAITLLIFLNFVLFYYVKPNSDIVKALAQTNVSLAALAFILYAIIFVQHYNETRETIITLYYREKRKPNTLDPNGKRVEEQYRSTLGDREFLLGNDVFIIIAFFISALLGVISILFYTFYIVAIITEILASIIIELEFLVIPLLLLDMVTDTIYVEYPKSLRAWKNRVKHKK